MQLNDFVAKILLAILLCLGSLKSKCQKSSALEVTAEFTGSGTYHCAYGLDGAYVKLAVRNSTTSTRSFFVWSCGWECWAVNKKILYFPGRLCEKNIPEEIKLFPRQQVVFYTFVAWSKKVDEAAWLADAEHFKIKEMKCALPLSKSINRRI